MCFLIEQPENSKLIIFLVAFGIILLSYHQMEQMKITLKDIKKRLGDAGDLAYLKTVKKTVDKLREEVRNMRENTVKMQNDFKLYKYDKTGMVDYAYGGKVTMIRETESYESEGISMLGIPMCSAHNLEGRIVTNSVMPGDCWPMKGQEGAVTIELIDQVNVQHVSLEHAPVALLPNGSASSAPKEFSLWGVQENGNGNGAPHFFGKFVYSTDSEVQTFKVTNPSPKTFKTVELQFHSNHGHPEFTCIYRVRIHGDLPSNRY